jgi:hypothetical protein
MKELCGSVDSVREFVAVIDGPKELHLTENAAEAFHNLLLATVVQKLGPTLAPEAGC